MGQQLRLAGRKVATVPIVAGSFATVDLPRGYDLESVFLRISASIVISVASVTAIRAESPCQLVSRMDLIADGKTLLYSAPFWHACLGNQARALTAQGARATTPQTAVTAATYAVEAIGVIDLSSIDCVRPKDSNFRTANLSLLQLRLQFGAAADTVVIGGATVAFTGTPVVEVYTSELLEEVDPQTRQLPPIPFLKKVSYTETAFPSSNVNAEIRLPAGNLIRSVMLRVEGSPTAGEPTATLLQNMQLVSGADVRVNLTGPQLRAKNNADFGSVQAGYYIADVAALGYPPYRLSELFDVTRQAEPKAILDITGGTNVRVQSVVTEYIPAIS